MKFLRVHFLNVGRGDCTIIEFPSRRVGIVDIDNLGILDEDTARELIGEYYRSTEYLLAKTLGIRAPDLREFVRKTYAALSNPLVYYDHHIGKEREIFRLLITHPDMDHMTGLYRLYEQESRSILNFWHTGLHDFSLDDANWEDSPYEKCDWETYKKLRSGRPGGPRSLQNYQGAIGNYWTEDGVEVWAPTPELERLAVDKDEPNILSMVLKISYAGRSIVLGGDATAEDSWPAILEDVDVPHVDVLKASHHGRKSGYYGPAVKAMSPWLAITSVADAEHDATENYRRYSEHTVSLRKAGDIRITIEEDGMLYYSRNAEEHWKPRQS
ncbi:MAG: ComEC/Rec2 family competence protein [Candidatus Methylomirabilales bacterium]